MNEVDDSQQQQQPDDEEEEEDDEEEEEEERLFRKGGGGDETTSWIRQTAKAEKHSIQRNKSFLLQFSLFFLWYAHTFAIHKK